nr:hypothetical protein EC90111_A0088 [Escherichia coli 9.0111]
MGPKRAIIYYIFLTPIYSLTIVNISFITPVVIHLFLNKSKEPNLLFISALVFLISLFRLPLL